MRLSTIPSTLPSWQRIERLPSSQTVPAGRVLFGEAGGPGHVVLIQQGQVKLTIGTGKRKVMLGIRTAGWLLGTDSAFLGDLPPYTPVTLTECRFATYSSAMFAREMEADPNLRALVHVVLSMEAQAQIAAQLELRSESAQDRLENLLLEMDALPHTPLEKRPILTQVEMAQLLAITPEHLCRILGRPRQGKSVTARERSPVHVLPPGWMSIEAQS